ncbi:MAG TPA: hypothetical protein VGK42_13940 [Candidatus Dormibacteraeota bacterium]
MALEQTLAVAMALAMALLPARSGAGSFWGSPGYGDPLGWCTSHSDMWTATVVTNDPHVGTNPEQNTFYGFHANPGYDEWYGYFYGDFRGSAGDASGWVWLLHEDYPRHYHWNFATNGWAVHGHAKQYIAYYNWTFGGECGMGRRGSLSPPPFMADQYGYPVVDIYVDSRPPLAPKPRVADITSGSVTFTWDPVLDQGDGAGADYFASGMDHYTSWLTVGGRPQRLQLASTSQPRSLTQPSMSARDVACVHVQAFDRLANASGLQVACARALSPPPMPAWPEVGIGIAANPAPPGLVGLDSWFWLTPTPKGMAVVIDEGIKYVVSATPSGAEWDFGDGTGASFHDATGFGAPYPAASPVAHLFEAHSQLGYDVRSSVRYDVSWTAYASGRQIGPYPMGSFVQVARPLRYAVHQAQPELISV